MQANTAIRPVAYLLALSAFCAVCSGCAGTGRRFSAESMPDRLRVASRPNPRELNLTGLAGVPQPVNSIGPGDFLEVDIAPGLDRAAVVPTLNVQVDDDGSITLPELGRVHVAGLRADTAASTIQTAFLNRQVYRNPVVTVRIKEKRQNSIRVAGGVRHEGTYELPVGQSDLLSAIIAAGGLSDDAGWIVEVRTPRPLPPSDYAGGSSGDGVTPAGFRQESDTGGSIMQPIRVNLAESDQSVVSGMPLDDGAVVMVQKRNPKSITVLGLVNKPGPIEVESNDITLLQAIGLAGGVKNQFANRVVVTRPAVSGDPFTIVVKITEARKSGRSNLLLGPGDVVTVEQTPGTMLLDALRIIRFGVSSNLTQFL